MALTLTRDNLVAAIQAGADCSKAGAERALDRLLDVLVTAITVDGEAIVRGLGTFSRLRTEARQGRNPRTGEPATIPAGYRVRFRPGKALRDRMPTA